MPDLRAVGRLHRKLNRFFLRGLGSRVSARLGKGRDFDRLREYVRGDDFRDIAWKASARRRKLIVREWRLDRSQDVLVCLDRGHRMAARVGGLSKLDHAVNAALLLAYICGRMEDRVGLLSFATEVEPGPRARARGHAAAPPDRLRQRPCSGRYLHTDYAGLAADLRRRLGHRTLVVVFTALPELEHDAPGAGGAACWPPAHLPLVVVLSDPDLAAAAPCCPPAEAEAVPHAGRAGPPLRARADRARAAAPGLPGGGDAARATPAPQAMNAYLDVKARQLL